MRPWRSNGKNWSTLTAVYKRTRHTLHNLSSDVFQVSCKVEMNTTTQRVSSQAKCSMGGPVFVNPTEEYFVSDVIACLVNATLTISTLLLNSIMIIAYLKSSQLWKNLSCFLITILSMSIDIAIGCSVNSMFTALLLIKITGNGSCLFLFGVILKLVVILSGMSTAVLSSMNIERYIAILHPMTQYNKLTKKRLLMLAILFWSGYIVTSVVSFASPNTQGEMLASLRLCFILLTI